MKLLIIHNLKSGLQDGTIFDFIRLFASVEDEIVIRFIDGTIPLEDITSDVMHFDGVVASGGDSTVSAICYQLRDSQIPILAFPAGTGNILNLNIGSTEEPYALARTVHAGRTVEYDLGEMTCAVGTPEERSVGFAVMAGAGYDAKIMNDSRNLKNPFGQMAYIMAALANPAPTYAHFVLEVDGRVIESDGISVLFMNFTELFEGISVTAENDARDGLLEVAILKTKDMVGLVPAVFSALVDHNGKDPSRLGTMEIYKGHEIHLQSDPPLTLQFDGESLECTTPVRARILPRTMKLFVNEAEYRHQHERDLLNKESNNDAS